MSIFTNHLLTNVIANSKLTFIAKNAILFYSSFLINQSLRTIYVIVVARILGPELFGLISYGQAWYLSFLPFCMLGLGAIVLREVSVNREQGKIVANQVIAIRIVSISIVTISCLVIGLWVNKDWQTRQLLSVFSFALAGRAVWLWCENMFQAYEDAYSKLRIERLLRPLELIVGISLACLTQNAFLIATGHTIVWVIQSISGYIMVNKKLQSIRPDWDIPSMIRLVRQGLPMGMAVALDGLMLQLVYVIYKFNGADHSNIANLSIGIQGLIILTSIFSATNQAILPALSRTVQRGEKKDIIYLRYSAQISLVFGALAATTAAFIGEPLVSCLLGNGYQQTGKYLYIILWILIPYTIKSSISSLFLAMGKFHYTLLMNFGGLLSMILFLYLLTLYGFVGVISSILLGYSLAVIIGLFILHQCGRLSLFSVMVEVTIFIALIVVINYSFSDDVSKFCGSCIAIFMFGYFVLRKMIRQFDKKNF